MSRQDKATTERNARVLRELVKQPDNKSCADCRKHDARWASWNLGVFLCIRCSGIHRSMGTHISKVKSIDLDIWTPEQMDSIQKWGNRLANMYWERHLKTGHVPPDHKIESFIRSKYESNRWAMDGPPPTDPRILENGPPAVDTSTKPTLTSTAPAAKPHPLLSRRAAPVDLIGGSAQPTVTPAPAPAPAPVSAPAPSVPTAAPAPAAPSNLFDLDFRAPTPTSKPQSAKADIMSLFSSTSPKSTTPFFFSPPAKNPYATWGGGGTNTATPQAPTQAPIWGMDQNAWGQNQPQQNQHTHPQQPQQQNPDPWGDPWAGGATTQKKDEDPFANIWK